MLKSKEKLYKEILEKDRQIIEKNETIDKIYTKYLDMKDIVRELQDRIDKANEILSNILVIKRSDGNYGAVKNTKKKEVYEAICMLNEILETPHRINYNLLGGKENE